MHGEGNKYDGFKFIVFCMIWVVVILVMNDVIIYLFVKR